MIAGFSEAVVHVPGVFGLDTPPGMWKTRCGWYFGRSAPKVSQVPIGTVGSKCRRCFEKEVQSEHRGRSRRETGVAR